MLSFTKEQIDEWRSIFIERGYARNIAELDNRSIDYFIMPDAIFQGIPNGLFRMTGNIQDGYLVGVSEKVPIMIQPHFALSEHDEFIVYGLRDPDRTLHSEQNIVRLLDGLQSRPQSLRGLYAKNKLLLYGHLLAK